MKPSRRPADAALAVKDFLLASMEDRHPDVAVGLRLPEDWQPGHDPAVVVFNDGGPLQWPVSTTAQIRVTVWADGRTRAHNFAALCLGLLLCTKVPGVYVSPGTSVLDAFDEHNGGRMAGFTVRVKARTLPL